MEIKEIVAEEAKAALASNVFEKVDLGKLSDTGSLLLGQMPDLLASETLGKAFLVEMKDGVGKLMRFNDGTFGGTIVDSATKKFVGQAHFTPAAAQAAVLGAFAAMSTVTGQYFLTRIDNKLGELESSIKEVMDFLYNEKLCEMQAEVNFLNDAWKNYEEIMLCPEQRTATLTQIQAARKIAYKNILFFERELTRLEKDRPRAQNRLSNSLDSYLSRYYESYENYKHSVMLYSACDVVEVHFARNFSEKYLESKISDLEKLEEQSKNIAIRGQAKLSYLIEDRGSGRKVNFDPETGHRMSERDLTQKELQQKMHESPDVVNFMESLADLKLAANSPQTVLVCEGEVYLQKQA